MGKALFPLLPEDRFEQGRSTLEASGFMLVADVRLDNRDELIDDLGCARDVELSDAGLLSLAYDRWREGMLDRLLGDFVFAVWSASEHTLVLARDPLGQRPLHYHIGDGFVAFTSMPQGLHALPEIPCLLNRTQLTSFVADLPRERSSSFFEGISQVEPGQLLKISPARVEKRYYWQPQIRDVRFNKDRDYIEAFREQLDRATSARLRGSGGRVGAHLSGGLDSSAVAATAARLMAGRGEVIALTSAPRKAFSGAIPKGRIADESGLAAAVVERYPNMQHVVVRTGGRAPLEGLELASWAYQQPVGHPCNYVWWSTINDEAKARGINVLLTGETGNLTISAGSMAVLPAFLRKGRWGQWFREMRALHGTGPSWRGLLAGSFGPWLPRPLWKALTRFYSRNEGTGGIALLGPHLRAMAEGQSDSLNDDTRPEWDEKRFRLRLLQRIDAGNARKGALALWGIDIRDPTADRRLIEFCLSVPPDQLLRGGTTRRLARLGLADRLPRSVLDAPRGYQFADWHEALDRGSLMQAIDRLERSQIASDSLDLPALRHLAASWPGEDVASLATVGTYRMGLLTAISAGIFAAAMCK